MTSTFVVVLGHEGVVTESIWIPGPKLGQYYDMGDYAGVIRRFFIIAVDSCVAIGALIVLVAVQSIINPHKPAQISEVILCWWIGFCFAYFVVLEASPLGTLGFLLTGVKIVTLEGKRPSILRMTFRFLLWILGPINAIIDLYWMTGDDFKQTLRDKYASTLVIRKRAVPAGTGEIRLNRYQILSYSFVFYEVTRPNRQFSNPGSAGG
jgi:uncharacterized RDD family membrane protein YckC